MSRRFFGSDIDGDYFEESIGNMQLKPNGHKNALFMQDSLPAFPQAPVITGGKIEVTDYFLGMPYRKKRIKWANLHSGGSPMYLSELDVYARLLGVMKEHELL